MERRNHARVAVSLEAALINDQAIPIDCRVRDVSTGGMLLQHQHRDNASTFHEGDTIEVRVALAQGGESNVIPLPMTVRRVQENGIAAEFLQPQSDLMQQLDPYRLDREEKQKPAANQGRASRRRFAIKRARVQFEESMRTSQAQRAKKRSPGAERLGWIFKGGDVTDKGSRKLFYVGLLSLIAAIGVVLLNFSENTRIENRMSVLESDTERLVNALTLLRARTSTPTPDTNELAELNARVDTLTASFAALETSILQNTDRATPIVTTVTASNPEPVADAKPQASSSDGPWVINLLSLHNKTEAGQFTEKARAQGIHANTIEVNVKGQPVWRVQVSGFATRDEARVYGDKSKETLGLKTVWVFKK